MTLRLLVADTVAEKDAAREVEGRVFLDRFGNTRDVMDAEYGPYADRSRFITVIDESTGRAAGTVRLILPDPAGELKTLTDAARAPWNLSVSDSLRAVGLLGAPVWDVATLAVDRRYRGSEVTLALCHALFRYPQLSGVEGGVTILDDLVLRLVRSMGVPWFTMPGATSQPYLGSPASTPCVLLVDTVSTSIRTRRPDLAAALVDGRFTTIASDPADLLPSRGTSRLPAVAGSGRDRAPVSAGAGSAWTPPAYRGSRLGGGSTPVSASGHDDPKREHGEAAAG